ncbi:MAG: hypothetical protein RLZZ401_27 [Pseudomonadota bacterium]|jgi:hypothetical protein
MKRTDPTFDAWHAEYLAEARATAQGLRDPALAAIAAELLPLLLPEAAFRADEAEPAHPQITFEEY